LDAISVYRSESRINEEMALYREEILEYELKAPISLINILLKFRIGWFKSKGRLIAFDEKSGKERKTNIICGRAMM